MRVDFYEMTGRFTDPLFVARVLISRAWPQATTIAVVGEKPALEALDERLWAEPDNRFLPHAIGAGKAPIQLLEDAPDQAAILINLDPGAPLPGGRFERILEIVPPDESLKARLRERWMAWKQRGADVQHHVLK